MLVLGFGFGCDDLIAAQTVALRKLFVADHTSKRRS